MDKAYDIKVLAGRLKAKGLDVAEDVAQVALKEVIEWLKESAVASHNSYDNLLLAVYPMLEAEMATQIDKIDGKEG